VSECCNSERQASLAVVGKQKNDDVAQMADCSTPMERRQGKRQVSMLIDERLG